MPDEQRDYEILMNQQEPYLEGQGTQISTSAPQGGSVEPRKEGWGWIGSPDHPDAQKHDDGISDLFEINEGDFDETDGVDDLVDVDFERDILDANENGDLEDLVNVTNEDIMGSAPRPRQPRYRPVVRRPTRRFEPPTSMRGLR